MQCLIPLSHCQAKEREKKQSQKKSNNGLYFSPDFCVCGKPAIESFKSTIWNQGYSLQSLG